MNSNNLTEDITNQLLEDLKDFYIWKQYINNPKFIEEYIEDRESVLSNIPRPFMSK
jgi:hypothetical protein